MTKKKKLETLPEPSKAHKYTQKPRPHTSTNKETTGTTVFERFTILVATMAPQS